MMIYYSYPENLPWIDLDVYGRLFYFDFGWKESVSGNKLWVLENLLLKGEKVSIYFNILLLFVTILDTLIFALRK